MENIFSPKYKEELRILIDDEIKKHGNEEPPWTTIKNFEHVEKKIKIIIMARSLSPSEETFLLTNVPVLRSGQRRK